MVDLLGAGWGCSGDDPGAGGDRPDGGDRGLAGGDHVRPRSSPRPAGASRSTPSWSETCRAGRSLVEQLAAYGVREVHHAGGDALAAFAGAAWASAVPARARADRLGRGHRGRHAAGQRGAGALAARTGVAMAANVIAFAGLAPFVVTRQVVGGAALEEMRLDERPAVFTVAGHAVEPVPAPPPGPPRWSRCARGGRRRPGGTGDDERRQAGERDHVGRHRHARAGGEVRQHLVARGVQQQYGTARPVPLAHGAGRRRGQGGAGEGRERIAASMVRLAHHGAAPTRASSVPHGTSPRDGVEPGRPRRPRRAPGERDRLPRKSHQHKIMNPQPLRAGQPRQECGPSPLAQHLHRRWLGCGGGRGTETGAVHARRHAQSAPSWPSSGPHGAGSAGRRRPRGRSPRRAAGRAVGLVTSGPHAPLATTVPSSTTTLLHAVDDRPPQLQAGG